MVSERILIVDDDRAFTEAASLLLEDHGYVVYQALTGHAGILQALTHRPDAIIIDAHLPDMEGTEVAREIKRALPAPHMIMISSDNSEENVRRCLAVNPDGFLPKALVHERLPNLIAETVDTGNDER